MNPPEPTERELAILKILWDHGEATVREIYEELRESLPIVQNTVQAFLRIMSEKGLVTYRKQARTFVYTPLVKQKQTRSRLLGRLLDSVFDGSVDQLVESAVSLKAPSPEELERLRALLDSMDAEVDKEPELIS